MSTEACPVCAGPTYAEGKLCEPCARAHQRHVDDAMEFAGVDHMTPAGLAMYEATRGRR